MDVLTTAWTAAGKPRPSLAAAARRTGNCARCGTTSGELTATGKVISKVFTGFDHWHSPHGPALCPSCTWGYRTPQLRAASHLVSADPARMRQLTIPQLGILLESPLPCDVAVIVPLHPGRKHLVPTAGWGRVTIDDIQLPWGVDDTRRLAAMRRLRAAGFGSRMLAEPTPPWPVFRRIPRHGWADVLTDWPALDPWRSRRLWFDLAAHATAPVPTAT